jgi:hypothetical protein
VKGAVRAKLGAVKGPEGAVVSGKSSREGLSGPGNPDYSHNLVHKCIHITWKFFQEFNRKILHVIFLKINIVKGFVNPSVHERTLTTIFMAISVLKKATCKENGREN